MTKKTLIITAICLLLVVLLFLFSMAVARLLMGKGGEGARLHGEGVGLVEVKGMILDSRETVRQLRYFLKQDTVKAVVLRIDSPGGVVAPSQEISEEVRKFAAKKKIVVSMGSLAASGGYYVAAPANLIYANPGTLTASIGVILKLSNIEELMDKIGIKSATLKTGRYKDAGSPFRPMSPEDRKMLESVIQSTHEQFVRAVADGRKIPIAEVRAIADGRILTGEQARALKLVDRLGTLQDAVEEAGRLAGIKGDPEIIEPPKKKLNYLDLLVEGAEGTVDRAVGKAVRGMQLVYE